MQRGSCRNAHIYTLNMRSRTRIPELLQGNKWRAYLQTGEGKKALRRWKNQQRSCKIVFACLNPVYNIFELNKFKMDLNSKDIGKPKLSSYSNNFLFLCCQYDSSEIQDTDPLLWAMYCRTGRRLQHDSTGSTEIHQGVCVSAEWWASEGTSPDWLVGALNAALDVCASTQTAVNIWQCITHLGWGASKGIKPSILCVYRNSKLATTSNVLVTLLPHAL